MTIRKKRNRMNDVPASSMSDIAFLLTVFFILSTSFALNKGLMTTLSGEGQGEATYRKQQILSIVLDKNGGITVNGKAVAQNRLSYALRTLVRERNRIVVIRVARGCRYKHVVGTIGTVQGMGIDKMAIRPLEETP